MSIILDNTLTENNLFEKAENASTVWGKLTDREGALEAFAVKSKAFAGFAWQGKKAKNIFGFSQQPPEFREAFKRFVAACNASTNETEESVKDKEAAVKAAESKLTAAKKELKKAEDEKSSTESLTTEVTAAQETFAKAKAEFDASKLANKKAIAAYFNLAEVPAVAELTVAQKQELHADALKELKEAKTAAAKYDLDEKAKASADQEVKNAQVKADAAGQEYNDALAAVAGPAPKVADVQKLTAEVEKQKIAKPMLVAVYNDDKRAFRKAFAAFEDLLCAEYPNNFTKGLADADKAFEGLKEEGFDVLPAENANGFDKAATDKALLKFCGEPAVAEAKDNKFDMSGYFKAIDKNATDLLGSQNEVSKLAEEDAEKVVIPKAELEELTTAARKAAADEAKKALDAVKAQDSYNAGEPEAAEAKVLNDAEETAISARKAEIAADAKKANAVRLRRASSFTKAAMQAKYAKVKASLPELKQKVKAAQKDQTKAILEAQKRDTWRQTFAYAGLYLKSFIFNLPVTEEVKEDAKVVAAVANLEAAKGKLNGSTEEMDTMKAAQGWLYGFYLTEGFSNILKLDAKKARKDAKADQESRLEIAIDRQEKQKVPGMETLESIGKFFTFSKEAGPEADKKQESDVEAGDAKAPAADKETAPAAKGLGARVYGFFFGDSSAKAETEKDEPEVDKEAAAAASSGGGSETTPPANAGLAINTKGAPTEVAAESLVSETVTQPSAQSGKDAGETKEPDANNANENGGPSPTGGVS